MSASIDALLDTGPGWNFLTSDQGNVLYYTFSVSDETEAQKFGEPISNEAGFNAEQQAAARLTLAQASAVTGIQFVESASGNADLHFADLDAPAGVPAYTEWHYSFTSDAAQNLTSYDADAYIYLDNVEWAPEFANPAPGTFSYEVLLHELGHALGLKHPFEGPVTLPASLDNTDNTVMSYTQTGVHTDFQPLDIAALQWIYGNDGLGGASHADGAALMADHWML